MSKFEPYDIKVFFGHDNPNNRLVHVRAEVDGMLVCRTWSKRRQDWMYTVESPHYFENLSMHGQANKVP